MQPFFDVTRPFSPEQIKSYSSSSWQDPQTAPFPPLVGKHELKVESHSPEKWEYVESVVVWGPTVASYHFPHHKKNLCQAPWQSKWQEPQVQQKALQVLGVDRETGTPYPKASEHACIFHLSGPNVKRFFKTGANIFAIKSYEFNKDWLSGFSLFQSEYL